MARASELSPDFLHVSFTDSLAAKHHHNQRFRIAEARAPKRSRIERESTPALDESVLMLGPHQMRSERGFRFGSDPSQCNVYIGPRAKGISGVHFRISFDFIQDSPIVMIVTNTTDKIQGTRVNSQKLVRAQSEFIDPDTKHLIVAGSVMLTVEFHPSMLTVEMWDNLRRLANEPEDLMRLKVSASEETPNVQPDTQTILGGLTRYNDVAKAITAGIPPWNSGDQYVCREQIAITAKSRIQKVVRVSDQRLLAVKMIVKNALSSAQIAPKEETLERELKISMLHATTDDDGHPNVIRVIDFCRWEGGRLLVMEHATCGNLQDHMDNVSPHPLQEEAGRTIMVQVWRGLKWLHDNGVSHGDLTAANVLLRSLDPYDCMISDFGESRIGRKQTHISGALISMAPEVARINQHGTDGYEYDAFQADMWSTGILACQILTLQVPELPRNRNPLGMYSALRKWKPSFEGLSLQCSDLLHRVLSQEPDRRPTAAECLDDIWHVHYQYSSASASIRCGATTSNYRSSSETVRPARSGSPTPVPRDIESLKYEHPDISRLGPPRFPSSLLDTAVQSFSSQSPEPEISRSHYSGYNLRPRAARKT